MEDWRAHVSRSGWGRGLRRGCRVSPRRTTQAFLSVPTECVWGTLLSFENSWCWDGLPWLMAKGLTGGGGSGWRQIENMGILFFHSYFLLLSPASVASGPALWSHRQCQKEASQRSGKWCTSMDVMCSWISKIVLGNCLCVAPLFHRLPRKTCPKLPGSKSSLQGGAHGALFQKVLEWSSVWSHLSETSSRNDSDSQSSAISWRFRDHLPRAAWGGSGGLTGSFSPVTFLGSFPLASALNC